MKEETTTTTSAARKAKRNLKFAFLLIPTEPASTRARSLRARLICQGAVQSAIQPAEQVSLFLFCVCCISRRPRGQLLLSPLHLGERIVVVVVVVAVRAGHIEPWEGGGGGDDEEKPVRRDQDLMPRVCKRESSQERRRWVKKVCGGGEENPGTLNPRWGLSRSRSSLLRGCST